MNAPAALQRQGIFSVRDNLCPGDELKVGRAFVQLFRTELEARVIQRVVKKPCKSKDSSPLRLIK
jgi:hypothetical protein